MSAASDSPANYSVLLSRYESSGQWERSLETARKWLEVEPENIRAHRAAGLALVNLRRHAEARRHIETALQGDPNNGFVHRLRSIVAFEGNQIAEAKEAIHRAISINPNDGYSWFQLASMHYRQGELADCHEFATRARELCPRDANIVNLLAQCETSEPKRLCLYKEALALDPENANVHNNIGSHYFLVEGDLVAAEASFRQALALLPNFKAARNNLLTTVKRRDLVFRVLSAPADWCTRLHQYTKRSKRHMLLWLLIGPAYFLFGRYFILGALAWCIFVWPLMKFYEFLAVGDIASKAGELGAKRGGIVGYRRWPRKVRLGILYATFVLFWGGVALGWQSDNGRSIIGMIVVLICITFLLVVLVRGVKKERSLARQKARSKIAINRAAKSPPAMILKF